DMSKYYVDEWKKKGLPWIGVVEGMRGFDAVNVVAKAIESAKDPTAPKIMAALKTLEAKGLYGLNKFDQNGQSYCNIIVTQVKEGRSSGVAITPSPKLGERAAAKWGWRFPRSRTRRAPKRAPAVFLPMLAEFVQHVVNGLIVGGGYALMGI